MPKISISSRTEFSHFLFHLFFLYSPHFLLFISSLAMTMAMNAAMRHSLGSTLKRPTSIYTVTARRTISISQKPINLRYSSAPIKPSFSRSRLQQSFRRSYADNPVPKPRGKARAGFFRWTWRLMYISAIGATGYLGYHIYTLRTPQEQFEPDPSKKTLVILGIHYFRFGTSTTC